MNNQENSILAYFSADCDLFDIDFDIPYPTLALSTQAPVHMNERLQFTRVPRIKGGILAVFYALLSVTCGRQL